MCVGVQGAHLTCEGHKENAERDLRSWEEVCTIARGHSRSKPARHKCAGSAGACSAPALVPPGVSASPTAVRVGQRLVQTPAVTPRWIPRAETLQADLPKFLHDTPTGTCCSWKPQVRQLCPRQPHTGPFAGFAGNEC